MRKTFLTFTIAIALLTSSCGQGYDAKSQVKRFMTEEMGLDDYDIIAWSNIDSTHHVKDSMVQVMRTNAVKDKVVKKDTKYQTGTEKLNLLSVRYKIGEDTLMSTFYFDDKFTGIVAMKRDGIK